MLGFVYRTNHNPVSDDIGNNATELSAAALSAEPGNAVCSNLSTLTQTSAKTNNPECTPVWVWPVGMTGTWHRYCIKEGCSPPPISHHTASGKEKSRLLQDAPEGAPPKTVSLLQFVLSGSGQKIFKTAFFFFFNDTLNLVICKRGS